MARTKQEIVKALLEDRLISAEEAATLLIEVHNHHYNYNYPYPYYYPGLIIGTGGTLTIGGTGTVTVNPPVNTTTTGSTAAGNTYTVGQQLNLFDETN